jgi:hypothetical protein
MRKWILNFVFFFYAVNVKNISHIKNGGKELFFELFRHEKIQ